MEPFFILEPEVGGAIGQDTVLEYSAHPATVTKLEYLFETWLGDDLLEATPCFIVTEALKDGLQRFAGSGYSFDEVTVTKADQFDDLNQGRQLPPFVWLKIHGIAGVDDCGLSKDGSLVVSSRLLDLLRKFRISHCVIRRKPYQGGK